MEINLNITGVELDPTKKYIIEVRRGDLSMEAVDQLRKALSGAGVTSLLVVSETGEAIKVKTIPEGAK